MNELGGGRLVEGGGVRVTLVQQVNVEKKTEEGWQSRASRLRMGMAALVQRVPLRWCEEIGGCNIEYKVDTAVNDSPCEKKTSGKLREEDVLAYNMVDEDGRTSRLITRFSGTVVKGALLRRGQHLFALDGLKIATALASSGVSPKCIGIERGLGGFRPVARRFLGPGTGLWPNESLTRPLANVGSETRRIRVASRGLVASLRVGWCCFGTLALVLALAGLA